MCHCLRKIRKIKGFSQNQLAEQVGMTRQTISNFEQNKTSPRLSDLEDFSRALGVRLHDLLSVEHTNHSSAA